MPFVDLSALGVTETAAQIRAGTLSPVELVEMSLERIRAHDARLRAWCESQLAFSKAPVL